MKHIDQSLLDVGLQQRILTMLEQRHPGGALACEISAIGDPNPDKTYSNIRYLEINEYISMNRLHSIGSNHCLEKDMVFQITQAGHNFLYTI